MRQARIAALALAASLAAFSFARADNAPATPAASVLPTGGDASGADLLGSPFENESAGISLRIPAGCHRVRSTGSGDDLGQFADEHRNWQFKLTRIVYKQPMALAQVLDNNGHPIVGLLDQTVARLKVELPGCSILRSDLTNVQDGDPNIKDNVGMIAVRYPAAGRHFLTQQAIIQSTERLFYLMALTTPASDAKGDAADNDPNERTAVETFRQVIDSVHLLDTARIARDQVDRLIRTRSLMVNWTPQRLRSTLIDQQWIRMIRNGKDVGYSYITEQTAAGVPRPLTAAEVQAGQSDRKLVKEGDGVLVGVRARSVDPMADVDPDMKKKGPVQIDSASWLFVSPDRHLEDWSRIIVVDDGSVNKEGKPVKSQTEEFGSSNRQIIRALDPEGQRGTVKDPQQPPISIRERYALSVTTVSQSGQGEPVERELPGWYLPQALSNLLPRLVPLHPEWENGQLKKHSFLFAVYVPDVREVMHRYVDVGNEQDVTFNGQTIRAIPITDRIGWHGSVTTHYMSPDGVYLGSENPEAHLLLLPTSEKMLLSLWKNADLTRPNGTQRPGTGGGADAGPSSSASADGSPSQLPAPAR